MNKWLILVFCIAVLTLAGTASASPGAIPSTTVILGFDDVTTSPWSAPMPVGYGGLSWDNFYVVNGDYPPYYYSGYHNGVVTPPNAAYNGYANPATISSPTSFDFTQAYFTSAFAQTDEPYQVQIDGYLGAALKYTQRVSVVTTGPTLATLNYYGVDRLVFTSLVNPGDGRRSQFVMDNFSFDANPIPLPTPTPLPTATPSLTPTPPPTATPPPTLCDGRTATIVGTSGNDNLTGTPGDDVIVGLGGDDIIDGLGGNDMICGNDGNDRLYGRSGNDRLFGGNGNDRLVGGNGNDHLSGDASNDVLLGGAGNDWLIGGSGTDTCNGQAGTDTHGGGCETLLNIP